MSDSRKRHEEMENDYLRRCRKYGEEPVMEKGIGDNVGVVFVDYCGEHAHRLLRREIKEENAKVSRPSRRPKGQRK